ncbi:MAG: NHLP bacteriocin system secretion protein [Arenicellales bacterium]|jgi:HlyD family secretion protein|nr:NHLP bacteriocin system secretion protein [Arenicellales bacterium]
MELFRKTALERLRSPEQLDEPLRVVRRKESVALLTLAFLVVAALLWSLFGSVPENGQGRAVLVTPGAVRTLQSPSAGRLVKWLAQVGEVVAAGAPVAVLDQPEIRRKLSDGQAARQEWEARSRDMQALRRRHLALLLQAIESERTVILGTIEYLQRYTGEAEVFLKEMAVQSRQLLDVQRDNLHDARRARVVLNEALGKRHGSFAQLEEKGLVSKNNLEDARRRADEGEIKLRDIDVRIRQLGVQDTEAAKSNLDASNALSARHHELAQLELRLRELDNRSARLRKDDREAELGDRNTLQQITRELAGYERQLEQDRVIRAKQGGKILEIAAVPGSRVEIGAQIAQLDVSSGTEELAALGYFSDAAGRRLRPGMRVRISPAPFPKERYGSIIGHVASVASFPVSPTAVANSIGNQQMAQELTGEGHIIEARIVLARSDVGTSGYQWTSERGPDAVLQPGTTATVWVTYRRQQPLARFIARYGLGVDRPAGG